MLNQHLLHNHTLSHAEFVMLQVDVECVMVLGKLIQKEYMITI